MNITNKNDIPRRAEAESRMDFAWRVTRLHALGIYALPAIIAVIANLGADNIFMGIFNTIVFTALVGSAILLADVGGILLLDYLGLGKPRWGSGPNTPPESPSEIRRPRE